MIERYHAGFSSCSRNVRLALCGKGFAFRTREVELIGVGQRDAQSPAVTAWLPQPVVGMSRANGEAAWADVEQAATSR